MNTAHVTLNSRNSPRPWLVVFGADSSVGFIVAPSKPSRTYKTEKAARKAAADWSSAR